MTARAATSVGPQQLSNCNRNRRVESSRFSSPFEHACILIFLVTAFFPFRVHTFFASHFHSACLLYDRLYVAVAQVTKLSWCTAHQIWNSWDQSSSLTIRSLITAFLHCLAINRNECDWITDSQLGKCLAQFEKERVARSVREEIFNRQ